MGIAGDIAIIVVAALVGGIIAQNLKLPIILGYILAGIAVGPYTFGPTVVNVHEVEVLADIGVALLLFTIGLEFPAEKLAPVKNIALLGTPLQIILVALFGIGLGRSMGWDWHSSIWFGCLISVSSTMVVLNILNGKGLMGTLSSKVMTAILIMQDLAVIPMMLLLPALGSIKTGLAKLTGTLSAAFVFVIVMVVFGSRLLPWFMEKIALRKSRELFMISVLALGLGIGYATYHMGISLAFGAFLAGMMLSRSDFNHRALSEIVPLRDLFSLLFFVTVGMLIDPHFVAANWYKLLLLTIAVFIGKSIILGVTTRFFGYYNIMPLAVGFYMFQVGEFAFVLARTGASGKFISQEVYLTVVTLAGITMVLTPFVANAANPIYQRFRKYMEKPTKSYIPAAQIAHDEAEKKLISELKDHIIMVGYGKTGEFLANVFDQFNEQLLVIEVEPRRILAAKQNGMIFIGGDSSSEVILEAARLKEAKLAILTIADPAMCVLTAQTIRRLAPDLTVLSRSATRDQCAKLNKLHINESYIPEYEVGLSLLRSALAATGHETKEANDMVTFLRTHAYTLLADEMEVPEQTPSPQQA